MILRNVEIMQVSLETTAEGTETYFGNLEPSVQVLFLLTSTLHGLNLSLSGPHGVICKVRDLGLITAEAD